MVYYLSLPLKTVIINKAIKGGIGETFKEGEDIGRYNASSSMI